MNIKYLKKLIDKVDECQDAIDRLQSERYPNVQIGNVLITDSDRVARIVALTVADLETSRDNYLDQLKNVVRTQA